MNITHAPDTARAFGQALGTRNHPRVAALLAPGASLDAILPGRHLAAKGRDRIAELWVDWLDWATAVEPEDLRVSQVGDRTSLTWRGMLRTDDRAIGDRLIEQHMVLDVGDGGIERIELVCTGMRRIPPPPEVTVHDFDAGVLGCTDGFPAEFRRQMRAIDVGHQLRVLARDPSARADLPAMTRLMGHRLVGVRDLGDGSTEFVVARTH
jgi:TusA-related sulfurtransferase